MVNNALIAGHLFAIASHLNFDDCLSLKYALEGPGKRRTRKRWIQFMPMSLFVSVVCVFLFSSPILKYREREREHERRRRNKKRDKERWGKESSNIPYQVEDVRNLTENEERRKETNSRRLGREVTYLFVN